MCLDEGHRHVECSYKDRTDLKFCTSCGVGDHSLEDFPTMLEKINNKKNVNVLSSVQKCDVIRTRNLQIVTRQGTKIGTNNPQISKIRSKYGYPNLDKQKQLYNDVLHIFQEFVAQEENDESKQKISQELINLMNTDNFVAKLIDLMYSVKNTSGVDKQDKSICNLNKKDKNDVDPLVDLEIEGYHVRQVILDFKSQANIMTGDTWEHLGKP